MKIAISTESDSLQSIIDQRFGRCKYFLIVEIDEDKDMKNVEAIDEFCKTVKVVFPDWQTIRGL